MITKEEILKRLTEKAEFFAEAKEEAIINHDKAAEALKKYREQRENIIEIRKSNPDVYEKIKLMCEFSEGPMQAAMKNLEDKKTRYLEMINEKSTESSTYNNVKELLIENNPDHIIKNMDFIQEVLRKIVKEGEDENKFLAEVMIILIEEYLKVDEVLEPVEEVEDDPELLEDKKDLILELFKKYGYDFNDFTPNDQDEIVISGNLKNMEEILIKLKELNIKLNNIPVRSNQYAKLLTKSSAEIIENVIYKANFNNEANFNHQHAFDITIIKPSQYINIRPERKLSKPILSGGGGNSNAIVGAYEYFIRNVDAFKRKYNKSIKTKMEFDTFEKYYQTHSSLFTLNADKVASLITYFDLCGVDSDQYLLNPTIFNLGELSRLTAFDFAIEQNCLEHLKHNVTTANEYIPTMNEVYIAEAAALINLNKEKGYIPDSSAVPSLFRGQTYNYTAVNNYIANSLPIKRFNKFTILALDPTTKSVLSKVFEIIENSVIVPMEDGKVIFPEELKFLEGLSVDNLSFKIAGKTYSKLKVARYAKTLADYKKECGFDYFKFPYVVAYLLAKDSFITQDEFEKLINEVTKIMGPDQITSGNEEDEKGMVR